MVGVHVRFLEQRREAAGDGGGISTAQTKTNPAFFWAKNAPRASEDVHGGEG
jgi:hypothetical protein